MRGSKHNLNRDEWEQRRTEYAARGQDLPHAKLLDLDVITIRSAKKQREALLKHIRENLSNAALARQFGVHERTIEKAVARETWNHI
jgi:DNA-directed RNA polymerase specialized sigma24 family protein